MKKFSIMKPIRAHFLTASVVTVAMSCRFMTGLFFGVDTSPVKIAHSPPYSDRKSNDTTAAMVSAAVAFLSSLDSEQRKAVMYAFTDNAQRSNWSNFPEGMIPRGGLKLGKLTKTQREKLDTLLGKFMSEQGVKNINHQLIAEDLLTSVPFLKYGSPFFYVAFLGEPSQTQPWMFQFGGHHLAINVTVYGSEASFSPMLTGGQPLHLHHKGEKIFLTDSEIAAAKSFLDSLTAEQRKAAVCGEKAIPLMFGPGKYGRAIVPKGVRGSALTNVQKDLLLNVISARLGFIHEKYFAAKMARVAAGIDDTYFGWWGPQDTPGAAYFRITGPSIVMEYSPQDDGSHSDGEGHAHNMYRDPQNDYGSAWIKNEKK